MTGDARGKTYETEAIQFQGRCADKKNGAGVSTAPMPQAGA